MIRQAQIKEHEILTKISFKFKGYWHYLKQYFDIWEDELRISQEYIHTNPVYVLEKDLKIEILNILADPNSKEFYEKMGVIWLGEWLSKHGGSYYG